MGLVSGEGLISGQESLDQLKALPATIKKLGEAGLRAVFRFSADENTLLRITPSRVIIRRTSLLGRHGRTYLPGATLISSRDARPIEVVSLIIGNTEEFVGDTNTIALEKSEFVWNTVRRGGEFDYGLEQTAYFLNIEDNELEVIRSGSDTAAASGETRVGESRNALPADLNFLRNGYTY